jgi:hypothetical protein
MPAMKKPTQPKTLIEMAGIISGALILIPFLIASIPVLVPMLLYYWAVHRLPVLLTVSPPRKKRVRSTIGRQLATAGKKLAVSPNVGTLHPA